MKIAITSIQHIGKRKTQQDRLWHPAEAECSSEVTGGVLALVADGMGGMANGEEAAQKAITVFVETWQNQALETPVTNLLDTALTEANRAVFEYSREINEMGNCGTTLIAAVVSGNDLQWISVGDSRLYLFRQGELIQLSTDHNDGYYLTSYVGAREPDEIDKSEKPFPLESGDWLLLCSDGLHGFLNDMEITTSLHGSPAEAMERVLARILALEHPHQDNVTLIILTALD